MMNKMALIPELHLLLGRNRKRRRPVVVVMARSRTPLSASSSPFASILLAASLLLLSSSPHYYLVAAQQEQNPQTLNGGSILAMAGKGCVAVAVDKRFGSGPQTINPKSPRHVLAPNPSLLVAFTGLEGDVQSLSEELSVIISAKIGRVSGFGFEEDDDDDDGDESDGGNSVSSSSRRITPRSMAALTSHVLYGRRQSPYFVEPIVAGLERVMVRQDNEDKLGDDSVSAIMVPRYRPFLCSHDVIGAQSKSHSFVCSGAASKSIHGTAEAMWQPDLEPEELVRVCGRAFLSALERDCLSGYGAIVYLITSANDQSSSCRIIEYDLACRND